MAETTIYRRYGYGAGDALPSEVVEGQELIDTDTGAHYLDTDNQRVRLNPPKRWQDILNTPDFAGVADKIKAIKAYAANVHVYGVVWDKTSSAMTRIFDSADITTDTSNFVHLGGLNSNYDNPFDYLYPWSECKQCNVDLDLYRALQPGQDIRDAVVAWYGDPDFTTAGSNGFVGRYTPEFWYYGNEDERGKIILVADGYVEGFLHHEPAIRGHGFCVDDGNGGVTCNDGQPLSNIAIGTIHSRANSSGFTLRDIYEVDAETALYMVEFADMDSQSKLGNGCSDGHYTPNFTVTTAATGATTVLLPIAGKAYYVPGATLDFATSKDGVDLTKRRTIVSSVDYDSSYSQVTFTPAIDLTTDLYPAVHGKNNADSLGNQSGYIGTNGKNNTWYRGAIIYGNRWQYILGVYRQTGTNHLWLCDKDTCDNYDALNTSVHFDTGITQYTLSSEAWQQVGDYGVPEGKLAAFGVITKAASIVGDQQHCPLLSNPNSFCVICGAAADGSRAGVLAAYWGAVASHSFWYFSAIPLLRQK